MIVFNSKYRQFFCLVASFLLPTALQCQTEMQRGAVQGREIAMGIAHERIVGGRVLSSKGGPVSGAAVGIGNNASMPYRIVQTNKQGEFRTDYYFMEETQAVLHFVATLQVSKKGFRIARKVVEIPTGTKAIATPVTLFPVEPEDATLLSRDELIKSLAPKLRNLGPEDGLSADDSKEYEKGVQEFLVRQRLDKAVIQLAKVSKQNPRCLRCRTMLALAELSWDDWDDARRELGESVNALIADRQLARYEPLLAFGVLTTWEHDPDKASPYLAEAAQYAPQDALVLQEYGRIQCLAMNWDAANETLTKALASGAGPEARYRRAEALLWAGTPEEAEAELNRYLDGRDLKSMPLRVRALAGRIQDRKKDEAAFLAANEKARGRGEEPLDYLRYPPKNLPDFEPADDQSALQSLLAGVGNNITRWLADLPNISALEKVHQEKIGSKGKPGASQDQGYRYLCLTMTERWGPMIEENRIDAGGNGARLRGLSDGYMLTSGFVSGPLLFHPAYQGGSNFRLLGKQKLNGRDTFLIAFAQNPGRARILGSFQDSQTSRTIFKQGLAWVDPENFQIVRIRSDLLRPLHQIKLQKVSTEIDLGEVRFKQVARTFWLPSTVTVTLDWKGKVLRNEHSYSDFMIFNVDSKERLGDPKVHDDPKPGPVNIPAYADSVSLPPSGNKQ